MLALLPALLSLLPVPAHTDPPCPARLAVQAVSATRLNLTWQSCSGCTDSAAVTARLRGSLACSTTSLQQEDSEEGEQQAGPLQASHQLTNLQPFSLYNVR